MLQRLAQATVRNFKVVLAATVLLVLLGVRALGALPIEAYPDVTNPMVDVVAVFPGQSAEEVERKVTLELEGVLAGTPRLINLHSVSVYGLSLVTLTFEDGTSDTFLRTQVAERLQSARLPPGATADLGPQATPVGQIYRYTLRGPVPIKELRAIQDWVVERRIRSVPGVADVVTFGGFEKQYQVHLDPEKVAGLGVSVGDVYAALQSANRNGGGGYVARGGQEFIVRGMGSLRPEDIGNVLVKRPEGSTGDRAIRIADIATVVEGSTPRRGVVGRGKEDEVVEGIVLLRRGENPHVVLEALKKRIGELNASVLPKGVKIVPFYDRTDLVDAALSTVVTNLLEGALLVLVVLYLFLRTFRGAIIIALTIPICLFSAFIGLRALGMPANLISLGAIDFGVLVEGSVIVMEAGLYALEKLRHGKQKVTGSAGVAAELHQDVLAVATASVAKPVAFALAVIFVTLTPIFSLERVEGRIFAPMAYSYVFALVGSLLCAAFVVPALERVLLPLEFEDREPRWLGALRSLQGRVVGWMFRRRWVAVVVYLGLIGAGTVVGRDVGTEFLPELKEGGFYVTMLFPSTIALEESRKMVPNLRARVLAVKEVDDVMSHLGRPEDATQAEGPNNLEMFIKLRPQGEWARGRSLEKIEADLRTALAVPGTQANFSQPITDRVWETISGIIGQVVIKIHGPDLEASQKVADAMKAKLSQVAGVKDLSVYQAGSIPQLQIDIDRERLARRGVTVDQVEDAIEIALGGKVATEVWEGERRFAVALKVPEAVRSEVGSLGRIVIGQGSGGGTTTLGDVSTMRHVEGRGAIWREDFSRFLALKFNVRGRDLGSVIAEAQAKTRDLVLPPGSYVTWGGEFENQQRAMKRLAVAVPAALAVIVVLLWLSFRQFRRPLLVMGTLPLGIVGALVGLRLMDLHFSVSAAIGCVALVGQLVLGSVLSMERVIEERAHGAERDQAIRLGFARAFRPVTLASALALLGLLPLAFSHGMGAETQRPFAVAILFGGLVGVLGLLLLLPVFESLSEAIVDRVGARRGAPVAAAGAAVLLVLSLGFARTASADPVAPASSAAPVASTAVSLTEAKAVELTLKSNASIVATRKMIDVASADLLGAGLYVNPRVTMSVGGSPFKYGAGPGNFGNIGFSAEYGQPILLFGQIGARKNEAEAGVGAARADLESETWRRTLDTRRAFARAWAAQSAVDAYADAVKDVSAIATILEARAKAGYNTDYDALRLGLERDLVKSLATDAQANLTRALADLVVAIGDKTLTISRVEGGEPSPGGPVPALDTLTTKALASRRDLLALKAQELISGAAVDRARKDARPVPEIFVGAQSAFAPNSLAVYGGLTLPLPFFNTGQGAIAHYVADTEAKKTLSEAASHRIEVEVKTARSLLEGRKATLATFESTLATKGAQLRKAAESAYAKGGFSLLELLDAYKSDRELKLRGIELRANLRDAQLDLMEAVGAEP